MGLNGSILSFGKFAGSELSRQLMRDETRALGELSKRGIGAPKLIFADDIDGRFVTLQKPLTGKPITPAISYGTLGLLASLRSSRTQLATDCDMIALLPQRIMRRPDLIEAFHDALPVLAHTRVPSTIIHGDFAPWNLREHDGCTVAFDWEYAELDGLPFIDETHYRLQVGYLLDGWDLRRAGQCLQQMRANNDLSLSTEQMRAIQIIYLIDQLARLFTEGYDESENDMVGWYCKLLRELTAMRKELIAV